MQDKTDEFTFERILFPTDFSDLSERVSAYALSMARCFEATLYVLHVVDLSLEASGLYVPHISFEVLDREEETVEARSLKKIYYRLSAHGIDVTPIICSGTPYTEILRVAGEKDVDMIVMGTSGAGGVGRLVYGSNTEKVLRGSHVPVLAIPPEA